MKGWFGKAKREYLKGNLDWLNDDVRPLLVSSAYTPSKNVNEFMSDISGQLTGGLGDALTGKTVSDAGVVDADNGHVSAVPAGQTARWCVLVQYTGNPATSRVLIFTNQAVPLPIDTDGSDVHLIWSSAGIGEI